MYGWLNVTPLLDGIVELGYDVVHPYQLSAGMDWDVFDQKYRDKFTILGGLDVQDAIGFGDYPRLERALRE